MILLNKFIFGVLDRFKKYLSNNMYPYELSARLSKNIIMFHDSKYINTYYLGNIIRVEKSYVSYRNYTFIKQLKIRFKYEKFIYYNGSSNMNISFNNDNTRSDICMLTAHYSDCYNNIFALSDENSIANIMDIIKNS